ncbi:DUF4292 domain-containing protein [Chitinophaga sp. sic0106]|uniref:DUF4292 domain-containing protein n=1 Tax=Chitinophaga sp. sic0106 TaxID=2854785 RepID=UPI001C438332|nr:DUF4292 domain-containing protein [Chitinophaga sp. sic0106]MBV7533516.1 DUF4292 domain-containing protein [Chitinophaga sp. sic0106]
MRLLLFVGLIGILTVSCRRPKELARSTFPAADTGKVTVVTDSSSEELNRFKDSMLAGIQKNHIDFNSFSGRAKFAFENEQDSKSGLSVTVRMRKDSIIWISISAPVIDEVVRAVITPDSLKLYNRLKKQLVLRNLADAKDMLNVPFDFNTLQNLLIGNPVYLTDSLYQITKTPSIISFSCDAPDFTSLFNVYADDYSLQQSKVMDKDASVRRSCELTYGDYSRTGNRKFPTTRRIYVEEKGTTKVALDFTRFDFDVPVTFPFSTPSGYKRM